MENQSIVSKLQEIIAKEEQELQHTTTAAQLLSANEYYNKLVEEGMIKKRGFTLRGIEDTHLLNVRLTNY